MRARTPSSARITPLVRMVYFGAALLVIGLAISLDLRHPLQQTMDILAAVAPLLLAATNSYRSSLAKVALAATVLLCIVMIAQPILQPTPWRF